MKRKIISVLLTAAMAVSMIAGCGSEKAGDEAAARTEVKKNDSAEIEKIKVFVPTYGKADDMDKAMEGDYLKSGQIDGVQYAIPID